MKKFLSLMLAMIMVMSLVTVGAGATFTDAEEIQYDEAVTLMTGLEILNGYPDGSFAPQGNLSRGAAAKIIAYIALGADAAGKITYGSGTTFTDVDAANVMAPYIAWCYDQGIVNGYGNGQYGPVAPLTGNAYLKMVLNAIGVYGKYTGAGWENKVVTTAAKKGLLAGIDQDTVDLFSTPVSREVACQIAFNAMKYDRGEEGIDGYLIDGMYFDGPTGLLNAANYANLMKLEETPRYVSMEGGKLLEKTHKVVVEPTVGVITENGANADTKFTVINGKNYNVETGLAQLGNTVKVYVKTGTYDEDKGYTVISMTDDCTEFVVTEKTTTAELKAVLKATDKTADVKVLMADGDVDGTYTVPVIDLTGDDAIDGTAFVGEEGTKTLVISGKKVVGVKEELAKSLDKVTKVDTTADKQYITFATEGKEANGVKDKDTGKVADVVNEYEGIAKGDFVVMTKIGDIVNVEKAETVTGKPTKIDGTTVTINGVVYEKTGSADAEKLELVDGTLSLKKEVTLYLDGQGNYIFAAGEKVVNETDIVYVASKYTTKVAETAGEYGEITAAHDLYFAQTVELDGTEKSYQVKKAVYDDLKLDQLAKVVVESSKTADADNAAAAKAKYATFTTTAAEDDVLFIEPGTINVAELKAGAIKLNSNFYFADEVTFLWIAGDKDELEVEVKSGVQALEAETVKVVYEKDSDDNKLVAYVIIEKEYEAATVYTGDLVYIVADDSSDAQVAIYKDGTTEKVAYGHKGYVNGVETDLTLIQEQKTITKGFYKVVEEFEGVQELVALAEDETFVVEKAEFTMFKSLMTIKDAATEDIDVTGVKVVDLRDVTTKITDATKIAADGEYEISVVLEKNLNKTGNTIKMIYVW